MSQAESHEHRPETVALLEGRARRRFHRLVVREVVRETPEASTFVLEVAEAERARFRYRAGQFVNVRVEVGGVSHVRSYSMSSAPGLDDQLRITVKRVPGGVVSNWLNDEVERGAVLEVTPPSGAFVLGDGDRDVVALAAGSGITPVLSIVRTVLAAGRRQASLLYANRDRGSAIFGDVLDALLAAHPDRFRVVHHLDVDAGFVGREDVSAFVGDRSDAEVFICGPTGFMAVAEAAVSGIGVPGDLVHVERFTPAAAPGPAEAPAGEEQEAQVTIRLGGRKVTVAHRPGTTLLQAARFADLRAPSSCESGSCATCMARVTAGAARMRRNDALTDDEVAEGWVLTCQAEPVTGSITVEYE